ncbi:MAG: hypothetical protein V5B39_03670 [Accumulibacter sp.]|uniref:hypothetical protein n=1 Tax=Accumulibacter sp. TaxID=2053492 RepID=UPI002FC2AF46
MKSTTSRRVKMAPRDLLPDAEDHFSISMATSGGGGLLEGLPRSNLSCVVSKFGILSIFNDRSWQGGNVGFSDLYG